MSPYTLIMAGVGLGVVLAHASQRDWASFWLLCAATIPFFAVPGLSDPQYLPVPRNSPIVGGFLAFLVGLACYRYAAQSWHLLIGLGMAAVMIWGALRSSGAIGLDVHAVGLELIFYAIMLLGGAAALANIDRQLPPLQNLKETVSIWRALKTPR